jgi:CheY-like chemotaxis protein
VAAGANTVDVAVGLAAVGVAATLGATGGVGARGDGEEHAAASASTGRSERGFVTKLGASVAEVTRGSLKCGTPAAWINKGRPAPVNHILVVDDDAAIRDVVADILQMSDYVVKTAANGAEALDQVRAEQPAAVLLDLMMPVMDGWEFLRRCRECTPCASVPVVVMSAAHDAAEAASVLGAQGYLAKPFDMDKVLDVVDRLTLGLSCSGGGVQL